MDATIVAAVLIAAVVAYDRLGGREEVARRLFQVGLGASLAFLVVSATAAFIRPDSTGGVNALSNNANDIGNRLSTSVGIEYGLGVVLLILGIVLLRNFATLPLGVILGGVLLIVAGGSGGLNASAIVQAQFAGSQTVAVFVFGVAVVGTVGLLVYGLQIEREGMPGAAADDDAEGAGDTGAAPP